MQGTAIGTSCTVHKVVANKIAVTQCEGRDVYHDDGTATGVVSRWARLGKTYLSTRKGNTSDIGLRGSVNQQEAGINT